MTRKQKRTYNAERQRAHRERMKASNHCQINVMLKPGTAFALDTLTATHGSKQAAIEHAINQAAMHTPEQQCKP